MVRSAKNISTADIEEFKCRNGNWIYTDVDIECDFVAGKGDKTYYIQVALTIDTKERKDQEYESLMCPIKPILQNKFTFN